MSSWKQEATMAGRVRERLEELGWKQTVLVNKSGLSKAYISMLLAESRGERMSVEVMFRLKEALRVPYSFFDLRISHVGIPSGEHGDQNQGAARAQI